jgi:membrane protein YdbS with pleckstrin-like domain
MFQNPEISLAELPGTDNVDWQVLDPSYKIVRRLQNLIAIVVIAIPLVLLTALTDIPLLPAAVFWAVWLLVAGALLIWPGISVPKRAYVLRNNDILFRKGVVWQSMTAIPFNRIQHVETSNTPFDRKYELATLQLFTAGGSSGDLKIDGLSEDVAEQLRAFILEKAGASIEHA